MPFRPDRRTRGADPFLAHKTILFSLGAGCAFAGMLFDAGWLVSLGIVILAIGVVLRFVGERRREREEAGAAGEFFDDEDVQSGSETSGEDARRLDPPGGLRDSADDESRR